jgi:hypothetical protein
MNTASAVFKDMFNLLNIEYCSDCNGRSFLCDRSAQLSSRWGPIYKKDKQFWATILFVVTRMQLEGGDNWMVFSIHMLKNEIPESFCVLCSNLERKFYKSQLHYLSFRTKFNSQDKGNPIAGHRQPAGHMLLRPAVYS